MEDAVWDNFVLKRDGMDVLCSGRLEPSNEITVSSAEKILHFARVAQTKASQAIGQ